MPRSSQRAWIRRISVGELVEFFRGDVGDRILINECVVDVVDDGRIRKLEQPPQHTQGWTATRVWRILRHRARNGMLDDQEVSALEPRAA